jgi:hypothetical protein
LDVLWRTGFYPLLTPIPEAGGDFGELVWKLSKTFAIVSFFFGAVYGLFKRRWEILVLLLFFAPYFAIHIKFPSPLLRYHMPIFWVALLICLFGSQSIWKLIDRDGRVPNSLVLLLQALITTTAAVWLALLIPYLPRISSISPRSVLLPYVAMVLVALIVVARLCIFRPRHFLHQISILSVLCLVIVSNQFMLAYTVGDGQKEKEFKQLGEWFAANAKPGEKLGVYMMGVVKIFAHKYAESVVEPPKADNPSEFIESCYKQDITYIVWATREGLSTDHTGYRQLNLDKNLAALQTPKDVGCYKFVRQIGSQRGFVNIFRLKDKGEEQLPAQ